MNLFFLFLRGACELSESYSFFFCRGARDFILFYFFAGRIYLTRVTNHSIQNSFLTASTREPRHGGGAKVKMLDAGAVISDFFFKWGQEKYILLRFRVIVPTLIVVCPLVQFGLIDDLNNTIDPAMKSFLYAVSDGILMYVLGAMQASPVKYALFPVWALALVGFRSILVGLHGKYNMQAELGNVAKLLIVAYMNVTHGCEIGRVPFWIYWSILVVKCMYRIVIRHQASKTLWHSRSSELLQAYMGPNQPQSNFVDNNSSPNGAMEGCKYLVFGESEQEQCSCRISPTRHVNINKLRSLVTLQNICQCLKEDNIVKKQAEVLKDVCLSFALSRLLRCRLEGARLHAGIDSINRKLLIGSYKERLDRLFKVLYRDVKFFKDCLFSNYPMIFSEGFLSLRFAFAQLMIKLPVGLWLSSDLFWAARHLSQNRHNLSATDLNIAGAAILIVVNVDDYGMGINFVNWTSLSAVCWLVHCRNRRKRLRLVRWFLGRLNSQEVRGGAFRGPLDKLINSQEVRSGGCRGQYAFLQSYKYSAWKRRLLHSLTMGMIASKDDGTNFATSLTTPEKVRTTVLSQELQGLDLHHDFSSSVDDNHSLPRDFFATVQHDANKPAEAEEQYWSEIIQSGAPRCSHVILIWHIATSLCEIKLAQEHDHCNGSPGFLHSALSCYRRRRNPYRGYLVDKLLDGDLWETYMVANWLSRYCAYLLVAKPDLLPGSIWVIKKDFQQTIQCARQMLHGCTSLKSIYDKLIATIPSQLEEAYLPGTEEEGSQILREGARLAKKLHDEDKKKQWEILAKVWARLLVHLSPSSDAQVHAKHLRSNMEFITIIWALFSHCGIDKSELWDYVSKHPSKMPTLTTSVQIVMEKYKKLVEHPSKTPTLRTSASGPPATNPLAVTLRMVVEKFRK